MPKLSEQTVRDALREICDPELGISLVDLGMIRRVEIKNGKVNVGLVLTSPGCPMSGLIMMGVRRRLLEIRGVKEATVDLLNEQWTPPVGTDLRQLMAQAWLRRSG